MSKSALKITRKMLDAQPAAYEGIIDLAVEAGLVYRDGGEVLSARREDTDVRDVLLAFALALYNQVEAK